jgi:uncharacterized protein (DUF2147 family)
MLKFLVFLNIGIFCTPVIKSQTYKPDQILGYWISPKKDLIVQCYKFNNLYYGKVVWFYKYYGNEPEDPDGMPENKWVNTIVMDKFSFSDNEWSGGEIHDLKHGKVYDSYICLLDSNTLKVTGYIIFRFLSQSETFTRYQQSKIPPFN